MTIDIHAHLIPRKGMLHPKMKETLCTPRELVAIMDARGVDRAVVLPLCSPESFHFVQSVEEVFDACDQYPDRFIKFCCADPRLETSSFSYDFEPILSYYKSLGAKGVGEVVANLWWDDGRYQSLFRACEKVGLPVLFHLAAHEFNTYGIITEPGMGGLERALERFPRLTFIGHSGAFWAEVAPSPSMIDRDSYPKGPVGPGGRVPELLRRYPNLRGDLSAMSGYNAVSRDPAWGYAFLEEYQDKLHMGLDICVPSNNACLLLGFLRDGLREGKLSGVAFDKIMGTNTERLLGL